MQRKSGVSHLVKRVTSPREYTTTKIKPHASNIGGAVFDALGNTGIETLVYIL